jgi:hypothetical protein
MKIASGVTIENIQEGQRSGFMFNKKKHTHTHDLLLYTDKILPRLGIKLLGFSGSLRMTNIGASRKQGPIGGVIVVTHFSTLQKGRPC